LVGLPARGKSFVARKLLHFLNWTGVHCRVFNVGKYRREAYAELMSAATEQEHSGACDANFFDAANRQAAELRERVADGALRDMLRWLDREDDASSLQSDDSDEDTVVPESSRHSSSLSIHSSTAGGAKALDFRHHERVAIFDATNSTQARRQWILEECTSPRKRGPDKPTGLVFVESICDDVELLEENYRYKVSSSPDFAGMPVADALADLRARVAKYEAQYETIQDDALSYIKVFNLSTKLLVNHIYGRMAKEVVPALMAWHIGTRPVFLCRPGQTISGICTDGEDYVHRGPPAGDDAATHSWVSQLPSRAQQRKSLRGDTLGPHGQQFRRDLLEFLAAEGHQFMIKRASVRDMARTGTSISGLRPGPGASIWGDGRETELPAIPEGLSQCSTSEPFPLRMYTSTMPRAADTVAWEEEGEAEFTPMQRSNLNPLDKGDFAGMELDEIREMNPIWFAKLERDPYNTRYVSYMGVHCLVGMWCPCNGSLGPCGMTQISRGRKLSRPHVASDQCRD
jgi:6-phosphofructo-2-kinase